MIEVLDYNPILKGSIYAEFTIYIPKFDLEIAKCKEFRMEGEKGPRRWFAFPAYLYETSDTKRWKPMVKFRLTATENKLWEEVRKQIDELLAKDPSLDIKPQSFDSTTSELPF